MKTCFKCGKSKRLSEFYVHPMMADGHLGKCKDCTKKDTATRVERLWNDPEWRQRERARCRDKSKNYRLNGVTFNQDPATKQRWSKKNKHKRNAHTQARRAMLNGIIPIKDKCEHCGASGRLDKHHPDYSKPLKVVWLCTACHGIEHRKPSTAL